MVLACDEKVAAVRAELQVPWGRVPSYAPLWTRVE